MTNDSESCWPLASETGLASRISEEFFRSGYRPLRSVCVMANGGVVTLQGRVPSYYIKQLAQHQAIRVPGALVIDNQLVVDEAAPNRTCDGSTS